MLAGKIALVTGAGRGIGQGCATELAAAGADVVINDLKEADLEETATQIRALGRRVFPVASDAFTRQGCQAILDAAIRDAGHVDILVSSPSYSRRSSFLEYPEDMWQKTLEGCLSGGFSLAPGIDAGSGAAGDGTAAGDTLFGNEYDRIQGHLDDDKHVHCVRMQHAVCD